MKFLIKSRHKLFQEVSMQLLYIVFLCLVISPLALAESGQTLAQKHSELLAHGINIQGWYDRDKVPTVDYLQAPDFIFLKKAGFKHLRLPLAWKVMADEKQKDLLNKAGIEALDKTVKTLLAEGFSVNLDMHKLGTGHPSPENFVLWWKNFASHYAAIEAHRLFFELLNEPSWPGFDSIQSQAVAAIRAGTPSNTILIAGEKWEWGPNQATVADTNTVHVIHFYSPMDFTHQGSTWGAPRRCGQHLPANFEKQVQASAVKIAEWMKRKNTLVTMNEFGVYHKCVDPTEQIRWIRVTREAFDKVGIPWSFWEYDKGFGLVHRAGPGSEPQPLPEVLDALTKTTSH